MTLQVQIKYIDRVEIEDFETIEAFLGSRVHDALEKLYRDLFNGKELRLGELLEYYDRVWEQNCGITTSSTILSWTERPLG